MEEIREGVEETKGEEEVGEASAALPTQMQLLSTWEVRRVPHNCVTRSITYTLANNIWFITLCVSTHDIYIQIMYTDSDKIRSEAMFRAKSTITSGCCSYENTS